MDSGLERPVAVFFLFAVVTASKSCVAHVNVQAIASQLSSQDEKVLIVSINSLSKVCSQPTRFCRAHSCVQLIVLP